MQRYKSIAFWWNDLRQAYVAQDGYTIVGQSKSIGGIKRVITNYLKRTDDRAN